LANEFVCKIYRLKGESIRRLYQQRLAKNLSVHPRALTIDKKWENIEFSVKKGSQRSNRNKEKYRRKKGLRIWNEEIKNSIENKRKA